MKKRIHKLRLVILISLSGLIADASAQQALSFPQGDTVFGLNLVNPLLYTRTLASAPTPTSGGGWKFTTTIGGIAFTSGLYYTIEFDTGEWARVTGGGGNIVRTGQFFSPTLNPPTSGTFIIRQVMRIADVFGAMAPGLVSGSSPTTADSIELPNGDKFFYNGNHWRLRLPNGFTINNTSGRPIFFVQGLIFHRIGAGTLNLNVPANGLGVVKTTPTWMNLKHVMVRRAGSSAFPLVSTINSTTRNAGLHNLVSCGLDPYLADGFFDFVGADLVLIQNTPGVLSFAYYYYDQDNFSWKNEIQASVSGAAVTLPSGVVIWRANPTGNHFVLWNP